jgi:hypothetical protein
MFYDTGPMTRCFFSKEIKALRKFEWYALLGLILLNFLRSYFKDFRNNLECLSLTSVNSLV